MFCLFFLRRLCLRAVERSGALSSSLARSLRSGALMSDLKRSGALRHLDDFAKGNDTDRGTVDGQNIETPEDVLLAPVVPRISMLWPRGVQA